MTGQEAAGTPAVPGDDGRLALLAALKKKEYEVSYFENKEAAAAYLDRSIDGKTVGFGDSETLISMGVFEMLSKHNDARDPVHRVNGKAFMETAADCAATQIFLTSVNAMAMTGEMVSIDGAGNRIGGSVYNHEKVYFIVGVNKIEPTLEKAIWRARNVAAPRNAKRFGYQTPCALRGDKCYDCDSPQRICGGMMVYLKKMKFIEMEIVLIEETLGF